MNRKTRTWLAALVMTLGLGAPASAAFPFPPLQCPWHEAPECPCSSYCCLHYLAPSLYKFRAYHTTPRYVYGCYPDGPLGYQIYRYPCRTSSAEEQAQKYIEVGREKKSPEEGTAATQTPALTPPPAPAQQPERAK